MKTDQTAQHRPLYEIAADVLTDWIKIPDKAAPYVKAMHSLNRLTDEYGGGFGNGMTIVCYFLHNAGSWRGQKAKEIKLELKLILKQY
jgi:hypothetical protein